MSTRFSRKLVPVLTAKATTGVGTTLDISKYKDVMLQLVAANATSATIKIQGSLSDTAPDFSATQTAANHWDYVGSYDLNDPSSLIAGDTGITFVAVTIADSCRNLIVNIDGVRWLNIVVTAISGGDVTANAFVIQEAT